MVQWISPPTKREGRRSFLLWTLGGMTAGFTGLFAYTTAIFTRPPRVPGERSQIVVRRSDLSEGANQFRLLGETLLVVLHRGQVVVLSAKCSHLGCLVIWDEHTEGFICPCHGAIFSADGTAVRGPTSEPLRQVPFTEEDGVILIGEAT